MSLVNPFKKIQEKNHWTLHTMAARTGISVPTLQQALTGALKNPRTLLTALQSMGYGNAEALAREYETWRQALLQDAREQVRQ